MRILLVEDDIPLAKGLDKALSSEGYTVDAVNTGEAALFIIEQSLPDVVILDIGLPDIDGLQVLSKIRKKHDTLPILMLTARDSIEDKVAGLDKGADDYLSKPFDMAELIARLRVIERRLGTQHSNILEIESVSLDTVAHTVTLDGDGIPLNFSRREYMLLKALMENAGKVYSRGQLESKLYSWGEEVSSNAIEVHIHNLRKKLPKGFIHNIRGIGYTVKRQ